MQQHPVPQNISSYEFRLVGDMTLKQFFQLAGGAVISLLFYASGLPEIIKWPLVLFFSLFGAALAFLPFQERPLTTWLVSFLHAVYSPTQYKWVRGTAEDVFPKEPVSQPPLVAATAPKIKPEEYLSQISQSRVLTAFEEAEKSFFQKLTGLFQTSPAPVQKQGAPAIQPPPISPLQDVPPIRPLKIEPVPPPAAPKPQPAPQYSAQPVSPVFGPSQTRFPSQQAVFAAEAAPPNPPTTLNTVVGQVLTSDGKIVEGAILEIKDAEGRPARAIKTNKVGHFLTVTPLKNGVYQIETEKEGLSFETVRFSAEGRIIPPILIRAKSANSG